MPRHEIIAAIRAALDTLTDPTADPNPALDTLTETARTLEQEEQEQDDWATAEELASAAWAMHGEQLCRDLSSYPEAQEFADVCPF